MPAHHAICLYSSEEKAKEMWECRCCDGPHARIGLTASIGVVVAKVS